MCAFVFGLRPLGILALAHPLLTVPRPPSPRFSKADKAGPLGEHYTTASQADAVPTAVARQYLESRAAEREQGDHTQPFLQDLAWGRWPWHLFLMGKPWSAEVTPGPAQGVMRFG